MQRLRTYDEFQRAEVAFRTAFRKATPTDPFSPRLSSRLLLYPIDYTVLESAQFDALATASARIGMSRAYFAGYGGEGGDWGKTHSHGLVDLHRYEDYRHGNGSAPLEHFLFAPQGEWGLVTSDGEYALVGGAPDFVADLRECLNYDAEETLRAFISDWREIGLASGSVEWVPTLLRHVFGAEEASRRWTDLA